MRTWEKRSNPTAVFWGMLAPLVAGAVAPADPFDPISVVQQFELRQMLERLSPATLHAEATVALLNPSTRTLGTVFLHQLFGMVTGAPLPVGQSLLLVWPQLAGLMAAMVLLFTVAYVIFQRQEIRA